MQTESDAASTAAALMSTTSRDHVPSPVVQTLYKFPGGSGRQLRLAVTRTYKAPTIDQLTARRYAAHVDTRFAADSSGNPELRPELANGIDYRKGDLTMGSSLSWQKGGWVRISDAQSQFQFQFQRTRHDLDAYLLYKFNPRYQVRQSASTRTRPAPRARPASRRGRCGWG